MPVPRGRVFCNYFVHVLGLCNLFVCLIYQLKISVFLARSDSPNLHTNTSPAANTNTAACVSDLLQLPDRIQLIAINYSALQSNADYLSICPAALSIFRDFRNKRAREDRTALLIINVSQTNVSVTHMFVLDCVLLRVSR